MIAVGGDYAARALDSVRIEPELPITADDISFRGTTRRHKRFLLGLHYLKRFITF